MSHETTGTAREPRTLIRNARQLLTLHGPSGSRRGSAMGELNIIQNGALLIHNGIVEEAGPSRRIENLAAAKDAHVVDASGRIVMPAFIDPDAPIAGSWVAGRDDGVVLRTLSRKSVQVRAALIAAERARYGCLTAGSRTPLAADLKVVVKVLRAHRALQSKPLRIRSVFSSSGISGDELTSRWLPAIRRDKLASIIEFQIDGHASHAELALLKDAAMAAAAAGLAIRVRSTAPPEPWALMLALSAGAIAIVSPLDALQAFIGPLANVGCVRVVPAIEVALETEAAAVSMRAAIAGGAAIALASTWRAEEVSSFNPQYLMHLAVNKLGMTPEEAIVGSTYNAACSLKLSHVTGSLEPGKSADLLMLEVPDFRELHRRAGHSDVSLAMRAGRVVFRRPSLILD